MTERLSTLLHEEATDLDIPVPEVPVVLHRGRGLRRRRRVTTATAVAAVLVLIGGGIATALTISGTDRAQDPLPTGSFGSTGAFSVGQRLYLGGREIAWDEPIKALYYTSAGVVVRSGEEEFTDSAGPSHYTLVAPDGEQTPVEINAGDRILGFEPDSTHVAYAEPDGKAWDVVVQDVVTGEELSRSSVTGTFTWGGWEAPPVALDGDWVWVHFDDGWLEVGWSSAQDPRLGSAVRSNEDTRNVHEVANGHYADWNSKTDVWTIRNMSDYSKVRDIQLEKGWYAFFSPDGNYLRAFPNDVRKEPDVDTIIYDVRTGEQRAVPDASESLGWTPDGHTLEVEGDEIRICAPVGGSCTTYPYDLGGGSVKVGGTSYES